MATLEEFHNQLQQTIEASASKENVCAIPPSLCNSEVPNIINTGATEPFAPQNRASPVQGNVAAQPSVSRALVGGAGSAVVV